MLYLPAIALIFAFSAVSTYASNAVEFAFAPGQSHSYSGFLWKDTRSVHLSPRLQALINPRLSKSAQICGFKTFSEKGSALPFFVDLIDAKYGYGEIKVKPNFVVTYENASPHIFQVEAYDCDEVPNYSERVLVSIQVVDRHGPVFAKAQYTFTVSRRSPVGSVVGQVQAIEEPDEIGGVSSSICSYRLEPPTIPLSIDRYGVLRIKQVLTVLTDNLLTFRITAEDCHRPLPRSASVDALVEVISHDCQLGWQGLPGDIEYKSGPDIPERLFWPSVIRLETCQPDCVTPSFRAQLQLRSVLPYHSLPTANTASCRHNPEDLVKQQRRCAVHPATLFDLLPDSRRDVVSQLTGPALGNPPRLSAPTMAWRFDAPAMTVWQLNPASLTDRLRSDEEQKVNPFDADFSLSFWLRRHISEPHPDGTSAEDREEAIFCSQDEENPEWRFLSVSLRECRLIVRLLVPLDPVANSGRLSNEPRPATQWLFGPLPDVFCSRLSHSNGVWHHYAISFSRTPWGATSQLVSLIIDGQSLESLNVPLESQSTVRPPFIPGQRSSKSRLTVGACFDPRTRLTKQHLNGELAGLTLLLGQVDAPNVLRCIAQCGESLLVPNVMKLLREDISVNLETDAITVTSQNITHLIDVLSGIAYARPDPLINPDYNPNSVQARLLYLTAAFRCNDEHWITIPPATVHLNVLPYVENDHYVESSNPVAANNQLTDVKQVPSPSLGDGSVWVPESKHLYELSDQLADQTNPSTRPPDLIVLGADQIVTEQPISAPGIPLFSDLTFALPTVKATDSTGYSSRAAAATPIDSCLVFSKSTDGREFHGERIDWPIDRAGALGLTANADRTSVRLTGRRPASDYAALLHAFRYWPPHQLPTESKIEKKLNRLVEVVHTASFGLACSIEGGRQWTPQFTVNVFIQAPGRADLSMFTSAIDPPAEKDVNNTDRIMNDDNGIKTEPVVIKPARSNRVRQASLAEHEQLAAKKAMGQLQPHQSIQTDEENQRFDEAGPQLRPGVAAGSAPQTDVLWKTQVKGLTDGRRIGLIVGITTVIGLFLIAFGAVWLRSYRATRPRGPFHGGRRRRPLSAPVDFGGANLKSHPALRITENPLQHMETAGLGGQPDDDDNEVSVPPGFQDCIYSPPTFRRLPADYAYPTGSPTLVRLAEEEEYDEEEYDGGEEEESLEGEEGEMRQTGERFYADGDAGDTDFDPHCSDEYEEAEEEVAEEELTDGHDGGMKQGLDVEQRSAMARMNEPTMARSSQSWGVIAIGSNKSNNPPEEQV